MEASTAIARPPAQPPRRLSREFQHAHHALGNGARTFADAEDDRVVRAAVEELTPKSAAG